ncbi:MAG: hemolysin III family protein [Stellaceae bacterium]
MSGWAVSRNLNYDTERVADITILASGLVCGIAASGVLIAAALASGEIRLLVGVGVYAIGLVGMLGCSLLYRSATEPRRRQFFRRFDHAAIFAMIAGSATPFALAAGGSRGAIVAGALWTFAAVGIVVKLSFPIGGIRRSAIIYLLLGWLSLFAVGSAVSGSTMALIAIGGGLYSAGVPFLLWWWRLPYRLAIWHSFVLAGAACHYVAILTGVVLA